MTILAFGSSPGAGVIRFEVESNSKALFHIDVSVTRGMEVIPESSALTDKTGSDEAPLAVLLRPFFPAFCILGSLAFSNVDTTSFYPHLRGHPIMRNFTAQPIMLGNIIIGER